MMEFKDKKLNSLMGNSQSRLFAGLIRSIKLLTLPLDVINR